MRLRHSFKRLQVILLILVNSTFFLSMPTAAAHGDNSILQIDKATVGPYTLNVWSSPGLLRVGEVHFDATVINAKGQPVLTCAIFLVITPLDRVGPTHSLQAGPPTFANGFLQQAAVPLTEAGRYHVQVLVDDAAGSGGESSFDIEVISVSAVTKGLIYIQILVSAVTAFWLLKEGFKIWSSPRMGHTTRNENGEMGRWGD